MNDPVENHESIGRWFLVFQMLSVPQVDIVNQINKLCLTSSAMHKNDIKSGKNIMYTFAI